MRFGMLSGPAAFAKWLHEEMSRAVVLRLCQYRNYLVEQRFTNVLTDQTVSRRTICNKAFVDAPSSRSEKYSSSSIMRNFQDDIVDTPQDQVSDLLVVWFAQCRHGLWLFAFHVANVAPRAQSVSVIPLRSSFCGMLHAVGQSLLLW
jgi:hypothetical protein